MMVTATLAARTTICLLLLKLLCDNSGGDDMHVALVANNHPRILNKDTIHEVPCR